MIVKILCSIIFGGGDRLPCRAVMGYNCHLKYFPSKFYGKGHKCSIHHPSTESIKYDVQNTIKKYLSPINS